MEVVISTGLRPEDDKRIQDAFTSFIGQAEDWAAKAFKIQVQSEEDEQGMENAKAAYNALRALQKEVEDTHKRLKEGALKYGQALDKVKRDFNEVIEPAKVHAREQAAYAETMEKRRKEALKNRRMQILAPFNVDYAHYDLENMPEDLFELTVTGLKARMEQEAAEQEKRRQEAAKAAQAEAEERKRLADEAAKAAKEKEKAQKEAAQATMLKDRQTQLLSKGFRYNGTNFVFGSYEISPATLKTESAEGWNNLLQSVVNDDASILNNYAEAVKALPKVKSAEAKALLDRIAPHVKAIVDILGE